MTGALEGLRGVMSVTGEPDGDPAKCGIPIGDLSAGLFCAVGILSALAARERTGRGQQIDTSLLEGALALSIWESSELWATGRVPGKLGSAHRLTAPYQALRTRDGHITVGGNTQPLWERLCGVLGREELVEGGVPCGPIHDYAEVFADPHTQARGMEVSLEHPVEGTVHALGIPVKLSETPGAIRRPAPLLGEHTEQVLDEAGFGPDEIAAMTRA